MSTINDFFEDIIGFNYITNPALFILYTLFIFWFIYQLFGFIYRALGIK